MAVSTRDKSKKQEEFLAQYLGAYRTPNSGATFHTKGDVQDEMSIFEAKTSMQKKRTYSIKKDDLEKNELERIAMRKEFSFLVFDYGQPKEDETYVVMRLEDFKTIYEVYKEVSNEEY